MIKSKLKMTGLPNNNYFIFFSSIFTFLFLTIIFLIPDKNIINIFGTDDAYYYFQIAKNISLGNGPTFDQITNTNGFQPLWLIFLIPIFLFENRDLFIPLRLILLFSFVIYLGWLFLLRSILLSINFLEENIKKTIIILFLFPSIIVVKPNLTFLHFIGGTEFILNIFLLTCVSLITIKFKKDEILPYVFLGLFSGLCLLARLDNILLIYFFPLYLILFKKNFIISLKNILFYASPACLLVIPYLTFNLFYFNELVPISGQIKMYWNDIGGGIHGGLIERIKHQIFEYIPIYKYYKSNHIVIYDVFVDFFKYVLPWYWHVLIFYFILLRYKSLKKKLFRSYIFCTFYIYSFFILHLKFGFIETKYWYWSFEYLFLILLFLAFLESKIFKEKFLKTLLI